MNDVTLIGNLADEPKTSVIASGATKCTFRLATQRKFANPQTGQREADFHTIIAWQKLADLCAKYLAKGRKCAIKGSVQYRSYDAKDGTKRYVTEIIADSVEFLGSPTQTGNGQACQSGVYIPQGDFALVDDDDLPF